MLPRRSRRKPKPTLVLDEDQRSNPGLLDVSRLAKNLVKLHNQEQNYRNASALTSMGHDGILSPSALHVVEEIKEEESADEQQKPRIDPFNLYELEERPVKKNMPVIKGQNQANKQMKDAEVDEIERHIQAIIDAEDSERLAGLDDYQQQEEDAGYQHQHESYYDQLSEELRDIQSPDRVSRQEQRHVLDDSMDDKPSENTTQRGFLVNSRQVKARNFDELMEDQEWVDKHVIRPSSHEKQSENDNQ